MAKGDTKTNQYLDIAANGTRADFPESCCETRSQTLIREVGERIMDLEDEVERLENNPDVADIVATYADLQSYDTSQLTDKDIVRVLQDETHDGDSTYYRWSTSTNTWTYIGESKQYTNFVGTDGTEAGEAGLVPAPATTDAGYFLSASGDWEEVASGGGATELTTDDYDYPNDNPNSVALWRLETGWYSTGTGVVVAASASTNLGSQAGRMIYVNKATSVSNASKITVLGAGSTVTVYSTTLGSGSEYSSTTETLHRVATTGTSNYDVMTQNATTSMVFSDPSTQRIVRIGNANTSGPQSVSIGVGAGASVNESIAIGASAMANGPATLALGSSSTATQAGEISFPYCRSGGASGVVNFGPFNASFGYNSSNYRLLTGLYDGQSAHDAVTVSQVNSVIDAINTALSTNIPHIGA